MINVGYIMLASLPGKSKAETPGANSLQSMPATLQLVRFALALGHGMTGHHARSFSDPMNNGNSPHQTTNELPANYIIPCGLTSLFNLRPCRAAVILHMLWRPLVHDLPLKSPKNHAPHPSTFPRSSPRFSSVSPRFCPELKGWIACLQELHHLLPRLLPQALQLRTLQVFHLGSRSQKGKRRLWVGLCEYLVIFIYAYICVIKCLRVYIYIYMYMYMCICR